MGCPNKYVEKFGYSCIGTSLRCSECEFNYPVLVPHSILYSDSFDSQSNIDPNSGDSDRKDTVNKLEFTNFSWEALGELSKVFKEAKRKYGNVDSWRLSGPASIETYMNALIRHWIAYLTGPDEYTEVYKGVEYKWRHSAQMQWNSMVICHKQLEKEKGNAIHPEGTTTK